MAAGGEGAAAGDAVADLGGTVPASSPADIGKLIGAETEKWGKVVKFAGIKML